MAIYREIEALFFASATSYLIPVLVVALLMRFLQSPVLLMSALRFIGVLVHELLHLMVGTITLAQPTRITFIPRREGNQIVLGSVTFKRLTWMNAWATTLAPLLVVPGLLAFADWRLTYGSRHITWGDLCWWILAGPLLLNCWPSRRDWRLVLISWPIICLCLLGVTAYAWSQELSFLLAWSSVAS